MDHYSQILHSVSLTAVIAGSGSLLLCLWVISSKSDQGLNEAGGPKCHSEKLLFVSKTRLLMFPF